MSGCARLEVSCILAAGSGLLVLLSVAAEELFPFIPAAVSIVSAAVGLHFVNNDRIRAIILVLLVSAWAATVGYARVGYNSLLISIFLIYVAFILTALYAGAGPGLTVFSSSYPSLVALFLDNPRALAVFSSGFVFLGAIIAAMLARKPHALLSVVAAPLPLVMGSSEGMMIALLSYIAILAGSGAVKWIGCPFRVDTGLVFYGFLVGVVGIALYYVTGGSLTGFGLYSGGLLLLLAGVLTPVSPRDNASSLGS
ncbi:MAG: hypothetical protein F7C34_04060 [Desulfurococcales archaeon]|nr:hypothetical protein [Desulfurococcales archaeon]